MATDSTKNNKPTDNNPETDEPVDATPGASKAGAAEKAADESKKTSEGKDEPSLEKDEKDEPSLEKASGADAKSDDDADAESDEDSDDVDDDDDDAGVAGAGTAGRGGFAAGSLAVVSAGLGLASLVGTSLSDMLRSRKELIGQIEGSSGTADQQIDAFYSTPWHTTAAVNGVFALLAIAVGGVLLAVYAQRADSRSWVKSVALGGVILGLIGVLVATGMYFDLFASAPEVPAGPPAQ